MTANLTSYAVSINEAWNSHNFERVLAYYSPDYIGTDVAQAGAVNGHAGLRVMLEQLWKAFPDLTFSVAETLIQDSRVAILWNAKGLHQGSIMNIPPTGRKVEVTGVSIIDVKDGLVMRGHYVWDLAGMLRHMGLLPEL